MLSLRTAREANVIEWELTLEDGSVYPGSCVPVHYVTGETPESVIAIAPKLEALLAGSSLEHIPHLCAEMQNTFPSDAAARAGVEIALYNARCAALHIPLVRMFGASNATLETDLTISRIPNALDVARSAWLEGFRIFKMKVGGNESEHFDALQEDLDRILGIAAEFPEAIFRLDANQSLTVQAALELADTLIGNGINLELIEQPVPKHDWAALDEISRVSPVPIIADEACVTPEDARRLFSETAVQGVNVKLMKSALSGALEIIQIAKGAGRKLMIGCMLENEVGMAASVALAVGTGAFDYIDLDGHVLLDRDHPITLFQSNGPMLSISPK